MAHIQALGLGHKAMLWNSKVVDCRMFCNAPNRKLLLLLFFTLLSSYSSSSLFDRRRLHSYIRPHSLNTRGFIGKGQSCRSDHVAIGFRIKVAGKSDHGDNTAMNGVRLICSDGKEIASLEGPAGEWTDDVWCSRVGPEAKGRDDFIAGIKIKTEQWRGFEVDDLGAINMEAICHSGIRLLHQSKRDWITKRGEWSQERFCPPETPAICGIKSRVHTRDKGDAKGDLAGLTEVQFKCCTMPGMDNRRENKMNAIEVDESKDDVDYYEDESDLLFV